MFLAIAAVAPLAAQVPRTVSRRLTAFLARPDTTVLVWVIARPRSDLAELARAISARGGTVRRTSTFVNAVSASVRGSAIRELAAIDGVLRVQQVGVYYKVGQWVRGTGTTARRPVPLPHYPTAQSAPDTTYGPGLWVYQQLNIPAVHGLGTRGAGVRIAMLDAGFNTSQPLMAGAHIVAQRDFVYGDTIVQDQPGETPGEMGHGTATWSLIAANQPGRLFGVAPQADFLLAKTEYTATETRAEEDNWVAGVEWAIQNGAQIISSSLGYLSFDNGFTYSPGQLSGDIAVTTIAADSAAARGVLVVVAVGNGGPQSGTLDTPADADSIVAVGATDSLGRVVAFSSRGPTADGRIKPEVVAPGFAVPVAGIDTGLVVLNGSSFSTPLVAGIAALVQSARPLGSLAVELRQGIVRAASQFLTPDNSGGYGIPDALKLYAFPTGVVLTGPSDGILGTVTPRITWDAGASVSGGAPNTYRLHMWRDAARQNTLLDTTIAASYFLFPAPLHGGTQMFWRVSATSNLAVTESTQVSAGSTIPAWATLLTLAAPQGATIRDSLPLFAWHSPLSGAPGPFHYDVDIYPASRGPAQAVASVRGVTDTTFQPLIPLEKNLPFRWRVVSRLGSDSEVATSPGTFLVADQSTPVTTVLFQNFPNPFPNPVVGLATTCIWFDVAVAGDVRLEVFDLRGRLVKRIAPSETVPLTLAAGRYGRPAGDAPGTCDPRFTWDGHDEQGNFVRAGVYLYRLTAPGFQDTRRIVFGGPP